MTRPSFSLENRVRRAVWGVVYTLLFRPSPRPLHGWRAMLLRLFGAKLGNHVHVYPRVRVWAPWNLVADDKVGVGDDADLYNIAVIHLKEGVVVSQGAYLCTGTHDYEDPSFQMVAAPITIGSKAWVCAHAFIGPGVTIGDGAVVGARAVVTRSMPEWTVCAGHPCRPIKPRVMKNVAPASDHESGDRLALDG